MNTTTKNNFDLEMRLVNFSVQIIDIANKMPDNRAAKHLAGQLIRSGTSAALNYGEAQSGESRKDFIHKMKIVLKELRETYVCLMIINKSGLFEKQNILDVIKKENDELIAIFVKSIGTAERNTRS